MPLHLPKLSIALLLFAVACGGPPKSPNALPPAPPGAEIAPDAVSGGPAREELPPASAADGDRHRSATADAVSALQRGDFEAAGEQAEALIAAEPDNAYGHLVAALVRYRQAMQ